MCQDGQGHTDTGWGRRAEPGTLGLGEVGDWRINIGKMSEYCSHCSVSAAVLYPGLQDLQAAGNHWDGFFIANDGNQVFFFFGFPVLSAIL